MFLLDGTSERPDGKLLWFFIVNCLPNITCPVFKGKLKSKKRWRQEFSCVRTGMGKINVAQS